MRQEETHKWTADFGHVIKKKQRMSEREGGGREGGREKDPRGSIVTAEGIWFPGRMCR